MIAGALVNESDIDNSLFTPDVRFPERSLLPDERLFFSVLPQAVSTRAEMMTRYKWKKGWNWLPSAHSKYQKPSSLSREKIAPLSGNTTMSAGVGMFTTTPSMPSNRPLIAKTRLRWSCSKKQRPLCGNVRWERSRGRRI